MARRPGEHHVSAPVNKGAPRGARRTSRMLAVAALAAVSAVGVVAAPGAGAQTGGDAHKTDHSTDHTGPGFEPHQSEGGETDVNVCSYAVAPGTAHCNARVRTDAAAQSLSASADASPTVSAPGSGAYGPVELQAAYAAPAASAGAGRMIAIVDAYDNPNAEADLAAYRSAYGLPECSTANGCFRKVDQNGGTAYPASNAGWATEISLDLQMVSAVCPKCNILLVEANSNSFNNLGVAVNRAATMGAVAISNSYGGGEFNGETTYGATYFNHPGIAITVSSGDAGYGVEYPAASQYVTAVGGTSLKKVSGGGYTETAWSGAGSGCSAYEPKPSWQTDSGCTRRSVADVSAVADPATGVWVYDTFGGAGWAVYGGTSAAAPIVGAVYGMAGAANPADYPSKYPYANTAALHDVVSGSNGGCGATTYLCTALAGYDGPTGLGTPSGVAAFGPGNIVTPVPDFTVGAAPSSLTVANGASGSSTLTLTPTNGFSGPVSLSTSVSPASGLTATVPGSVTVNGTTTASLGVQATAAGTYTVTVTATSGALVHSTNVTVTVPAPTPNFTISASPTTRTVTRGSSTTYTVTVARTGGFTGAVTLGVSGLQTRDTVTYSANPIASAATTATITVRTSTRDARQTRTLTITGTGGGLSRTAKVTLTYN